jgi:DNA polymerase III subunit alpha
MGDIEALGFVKLDVLGLKALSILHICMENLGRDVFDGLDWIPTSDRSTYAMIAKGRTDGVFQLEGWSAKSGVVELKPTKLGDIIASMALFRKATMKSGATASYIRRRHKQEEIPQRHELLERTVKETYGIIVYQEQVISILRELGMEPDDLTAFLKAVKASNSSIGGALEVIEGYVEQIKELARLAGVGDEDFKWLWSAIEGFAEYGFNKAHAAAYGLTAYRCAYLANHHSVEFFAAVLAVWAGDKKEKGYIEAARRRGISIRRPDINKSGATYSVDPNGKHIRKGLLAIKGIGTKVAERIVECRPEGGYASLDEFCRLVGSKVSGTKAFLSERDTEVGAFKKLYDSGAFGGLIDE